VGRMRGVGIRSYAVFGAAYGLASLGCSLPIFLSVVAISLQGGALWSGVLRFMLFGLGMGSILAVLSIATASLGSDSLRRLRFVGPHFEIVSAVLLWLAGSYVLYYWLTIGRLL
jgi:cytochrome c-type biogenesis protein